MANYEELKCNVWIYEQHRECGAKAYRVVTAIREFIPAPYCKFHWEESASLFFTDKYYVIFTPEEFEVWKLMRL
jgi:hypothetical protein